MPRISLDFLDSSPWPISILDIFLNINQTEFLTYVTGPHLSKDIFCEFQGLRIERCWACGLSQMGTDVKWSLKFHCRCIFCRTCRTTQPGGSLFWMSAGSSVGSENARCQEQYAQKNPVRPPAVPLESIHWQPPLDIVERHLSIHEICKYIIYLISLSLSMYIFVFFKRTSLESPQNLSTAKHFSFPNAFQYLILAFHLRTEELVAARLSRHESSREISVAVFGTHATLSLEPVDMLGRSQKILRPEWKFRAWCVSYVW